MASNFEKFMKANKKPKGNRKYAPTRSLCNENGEPLEWEFRPVSTKENNDLAEDYTKEIPIPGKPGMFRNKVDYQAYVTNLICTSVVYPDLYDEDLQDSYGVTTPEELLLEMIDDPGEYNELMRFVQEFLGFETLEEKVEQAKN